MVITFLTVDDLAEFKKLIDNMNIVAHDMKVLTAQISELLTEIKLQSRKRK